MKIEFSYFGLCRIRIPRPPSFDHRACVLDIIKSPCSTSSSALKVETKFLKRYKKGQKRLRCSAFLVHTMDISVGYTLWSGGSAVLLLEMT